MHMRREDVFPGRFLTKSEIGAMHAGDRVLIVVRVEVERFDDEDPRDAKPIMFFREGPKGVPLNKTNWDILAHAYGDDSDDWIGRPVELTIDPNVTYGGKRCGGIRVGVPAAISNIPAKSPAGQQLMTWAEYVQLASTAGISEDELKVEFKAKGCTKLNADAGRVIADLIAARRAAATGTADPGSPVADDIPF
jgi:hypothetical protein